MCLRASCRTLIGVQQYAVRCASDERQEGIDYSFTHAEVHLRRVALR